jgi:hypothetical protein
MSRIDWQAEQPYQDVLKGILAFSSFAEAEETLKSLQNLCREYQAACDKKGVEYCRKIALLGRRRAEFISRNKRVNPDKRLQKQEIATWFRIWLETPAIFDHWLSMRKNTEEFQNLLQHEHKGS